MPFVALLIGVILAGIDQVIKYFVLTNLQPVGTVNIIGDVFKLTYVENRGVAFGMFSDMRWLFITLTTILLAVIIIYMFKKDRRESFSISAQLLLSAAE